MKMTTQQVESVEKSVGSIISQITGLSSGTLDPSTPIAKMGIDSLMALSIIANVERRFKISIPEKRLREIKNINSIISLIREYSPS